MECFHYLLECGGRIASQARISHSVYDTPPTLILSCHSFVLDGSPGSMHRFSSPRCLDNAGNSRHSLCGEPRVPTYCCVSDFKFTTAPRRTRSCLLGICDICGEGMIYICSSTIAIVRPVYFDIHAHQAQVSFIQSIVTWHQDDHSRRGRYHHLWWWQRRLCARRPPR